MTSDTSATLPPAEADEIQEKLDRGNEHRRNILSALVSAESDALNTSEIRERANVPSGSIDDRSHTTLGEIDQRLTAIDVFGVLIAVNITFDILRKIGVPKLPTGTCGVFAFRNAKPIVLPVVGAFDVFRLYLGNFECSKPDVATQLDDEIIAMVCSGPP